MSGNGIQVRLRQDAVIPLDVEFNCQPGEILVIVGPSGSGKSTTLRAISGLYTPEFGTISSNAVSWLDTDKAINLPVQQRKIGIVFQHYALFPHMTALENIMIALGDNGIDKKQRAQQLLNLINMEGLDDRLPNQLSGGQQQRIALARALAREPEVLLLDEPFSAVDQQTRRKLVRELLQLHKKIQIPIIHVTHNMNEARRIADRLCILHHGKTLQIDNPDVVMSKPVNSNVANLIGHYNIYGGVVERHDEEKQITWLRWQDTQLETGYQPQIESGKTCRWVIPTESIILHRQDRPSRGERENPIHGKIAELIKLGESTSIKMTTAQKAAVYLNISSHVAKRNNLTEGGDISVSFLGEAIHLMPVDD